MNWPEDFPNTPLGTEKIPTIVYNPGKINDYGNTINQILEDKIFYTKFYIIKIFLRNLENRLSIKDLQEIQEYLNTMNRIGDVNFPKNGIPFIHYLIKIYYIYSEQNLSISIEIYEFIKKLLKIPGLNLNLKDVKGNTPLMLIYKYQNETSSNIKNGKKYLVLEKLKELEVLIDINGGEVSFTEAQQTIIDEEIGKSNKAIQFHKQTYAINQYKINNEI